MPESFSLDDTSLSLSLIVLVLEFEDATDTVLGRRTWPLVSVEAGGAAVGASTGFVSVAGATSTVS